MKKNAFITGSNKGIGFETARQLGKKGFRVFISGRDKNRIKEALDELLGEKIEAEMLIMDVSDPLSIKKAADDFSGFDTKLDVLISNAGILFREDVSLLKNSADVLEKTIRTNSYGPQDVAKAFLPFMKKPGRIINISSGGGSMTDEVGGWAPAYCVSKTLLNSITRHLACELQDSDISVNAVCPGWVRTDMGGRSATRPVEKGAETPVWLATEAPQRLSGRFFRDKAEIPW